MRLERKRTEKIGKRGVPDIKSARVCTKRRHHHSIGVRGEASPAHHASPVRYARHGMEMSANFSRLSAWHMAEGQRSQCHCKLELTADALRRFRIMISGDPYPFAPSLHDVQGVAVVVGQPGRAAAVMEAVTKRNDAAWSVVCDHAGKMGESVGRVIGGQQDSARRKTRALLEM